MPTSDDYKVAGAATGLSTPDGIVSNIERIGNQNDRIISQLHGKMYEQALRLNLFHACSQAITTTTVGLATTYTGLSLMNPVGGTTLLVPRQIGISLSDEPAASSAIGIGGGYALTGFAHTTPLVTYSAVLGNGQAAIGLADAAATLPAGAGAGLLRVILPTLGGFTDAALFAHGGVVDLEGSIIIPAGGFIFIYTETVVKGTLGISWEEIPA